MITVTCKTDGCLNRNHPVPVQDDGTAVVCGGGCNNILRPDNPDHPNYPEPPESEPTIDELIERKLRDLGVIP